MADAVVRFFGAARAAAGVDEERVSAGVTLDALLTHLRARPATSGAPSLARVIDRSSFLLNEVSLRDRTVTLSEGDVLDILPPFAGG